MMFPYARRPCAECPWRRDAEPGKFPPERYAALRRSVRRPDDHGATDAALDDPLFACHMTKDGHEQACAGWLAREGWGHLRVRVAVLRADLPLCALSPGEGWPPLVASYDELAARNGLPGPAPKESSES